VKKLLGVLFILLALLLFALATATLFKVTLGTAIGVMGCNFGAYLVLTLGAGLLKS
jgi:hypothetical protein